jgi:hypothetical protein
MRAKNKEELADAAGYLTSMVFFFQNSKLLFYFECLEMGDLGQNFFNCWFEKPYLWCMFFRNYVFQKGNNKTNLLKR